jgi:hypothetical protein
MSEITEREKLSIDFSHRLNGAIGIGTTLRLHECVNSALERAAAVADLMEVVFQADMETDVRHLWRAAEVISFELLEARAIITAYDDNNKINPDEMSA